MASISDDFTNRSIQILPNQEPRRAAGGHIIPENNGRPNPISSERTSTVKISKSRRAKLSTQHSKDILLTEEIVGNILEFCESQDIERMALVCKSWNKGTNTNYTWFIRWRDGLPQTFCAIDQSIDKTLFFISRAVPQGFRIIKKRQSGSFFYSGNDNFRTQRMEESREDYNSDVKFEIEPIYYHSAADYKTLYRFCILRKFKFENQADREHWLHYFSPSFNCVNRIIFIAAYSVQAMINSTELINHCREKAICSCVSCDRIQQRLIDTCSEVTFQQLRGITWGREINRLEAQKRWVWDCINERIREREREERELRERSDQSW